MNTKMKDSVSDAVSGADELLNKTSSGILGGKTHDLSGVAPESDSS